MPFGICDTPWTDQPLRTLAPCANALSISILAHIFRLLIGRMAQYTYVDPARSQLSIILRDGHIDHTAMRHLILKRLHINMLADQLNALDTVG